VGYEAYNIWRIWIPTNRRIIRARDVQFNKQEFYNPSLTNQKIRIYDDADPIQLIAVLDDEETTRIINDIDTPIPADQSANTPVQQDLGGGSTTTTTTANFDYATPQIQLTPDQNPSNPDEILGDQPITPPLNAESDGSILDLDQSLDQPHRSDQLLDQPFVLINNTNFDPSGYETLYTTTKRPRSDSDTSRDQDKVKRPHFSLTTFLQAFSSNQIKQPKILISSIPPAPSGYNQLASHPFETQFRQAIQVEFNKLLDIHAFEPISATYVKHTHQSNCKDLD
jgi:hypothetical protein